MGVEIAPLFGPTLGLMALRSVWNVGPIGVWPIFLLRGEPLGWRAGDIAPPSAENNNVLILLLSWTGQESENHSPPCAAWLQIRKSPDGGEIVSDGSRHEPFCTALLEQVSESISSFKRAVYRPNQMVRLPLDAGPSQDTACIRVTLPVMFVSRIRKPRRPDGRQFVGAGPSGESPKAQEHSGLRALRETVGVQ
jgi:hypothetical protein